MLYSLVEYIRPEAFRRKLLEAGWSLSSSSFASETWLRPHKQPVCVSVPYRFTFPVCYFGPDYDTINMQIHNINYLGRCLNADPSQLVQDLLSYSLQIYSELEDVVRDVASYGSVGGNNANEVLPETFRAKLIYAIDSAYASPKGSPERGGVDHAF